MFPPQCLFCNHVNPAGAKFCNDCGSQLHVKRCSRCEAVSDQAAKNCFKCNMEFPVLSTQSEAPPMSSARNTTGASPAYSERLPFRFDFILDELPKPVPSATGVTAAAQTSVASEPSFATASSPAPQLARPAAAIELDKLDRTREPRSLDELPKPVPSATGATAAAQTSVGSEPSFATASSPAPQLARPAAAIELDKLDRTREPRSLDELPEPAPSATEVTAAAQTSVASEPSFATASSPAPPGPPPRRNCVQCHAWRWPCHCPP